MKNLMLSVLVICSVISANAFIEFKSTVTRTDQIDIEIVAVNCSDVICFLHDAGGATRLHLAVDDYTFGGYSVNYSVLNSRNVIVGRGLNSQQEQLISYAKHVSKSCPMKVKIDTTDFTILEVLLKCNPNSNLM